MPATWRLTCAYRGASLHTDDPVLGGEAKVGGERVACRGSRAHNGYMGRIIGTILSAILAIWLVVTFAGGILATLKTFLIIGLIAMVVFIVVWLVARGSRRS
jgi:fructose-specific phosphotransferase system IIC component